MPKLALICSLNINHEWYCDSTPSLVVSPSTVTARQMNRDGLLFRTVPGGCEVYSSSDEFDGSELELNVFSRDPLLFAHTFTGEREAGGIPKVANVTFTAENPEKHIEPADWQPAELRNEPWVRLSVILPSSKVPLFTTLNIPAISVFWTYVVNGPWLPDNLEITAIDGSEQFTELSASAVGFNNTANPASTITRVFRSRVLRPSKRTDNPEYRLVSSDSTTGPLVSPLPCPAPNVLPRPISGSDSFEVPIYVTVLAKGSS